jgi:cbb3-type cytochrome c oxidase subunit II
MRIYERFNGILLLAGLCQLMAATVIVILPWTLTVADEDTVVDVNGNRVKVPPYTQAQAAGKEIYQKQVCWHCHSQFVRPVNDESSRFGPVSQAGESAIDRPHVFGTRRIGPDLAREGGMRPDDWQLMHLFDPRAAVSQSVMPSFTWLFHDSAMAGEVKSLLALYDYDGNGVVEPDFDSIIAPLPTDTATQNRLAGADRVGLIGSRYKQDPTGADLKAGPDGKRPYVDAYTQVLDPAGRAGEEGDKLVSDRDGAPEPTEDTRNLLAYIQRLGTAIGSWRQPLAGPMPHRGNQDARPPMKGVTVKWKDSAGKEAESSVEDGQMPRRERKARLYGEALKKAKDEQKAEAADYVREYDLLMAAWRKANPAWDARLTKGQELFTRHCTSCHGPEGRGNGPGAQFLNPRPRDFTIANFNFRSTQAGNLPLDADLYRTIWRGLPGTAMPSWRELSDSERWLLVDFVQTFIENIDGNRGAEFDEQAKALSVPPFPAVKAEQLDAVVKRGKAVFAAAKCSNCHGTEGRGDGPGWLTTKLASGGTIRPRDFKPRDAHDRPALRMRGGAFPQELYRTFFTGLGPQMPSSMIDFNDGWRLADAVDTLTAAGAPAEKIDEAKKAARRALIVPLYDEDLVKSHGVTREMDPATGQTTEYIDRLRRTTKDQVGDDWALIFYVLDLMQARDLIPLSK